MQAYASSSTFSGSSAKKYIFAVLEKIVICREYVILAFVLSKFLSKDLWSDFRSSFSGKRKCSENPFFSVLPSPIVCRSMGKIYGSNSRHT
jgi:hypothetical protein